jgi:hypothetical protein
MHLTNMGSSMKGVRLLAVLLVLAASPVFAGQTGQVEEWALYPFVQYFTWEEFRDGARILKEKGLLVGAGGTVRLDLYDRQLMLKAKGELFGGNVGYDGHTQQSFLPPPNPPNTPDPTSERPVKTDVIYFGIKAEADMGWRFPLTHGSFEPFAGLGYRWWLRSLQESTTLDANGVPLQVGGYPEYWQSLYARLGTRAGWSFGGDLTLFAEAGMKYPLYNENLADFPGTGRVAIKPGQAWSAFAEISATHKRFRPSIFYEGFRFSPSSTVRAFSTIENSFILVNQPKSDSDIFGINLGWVFD